MQELNIALATIGALTVALSLLAGLNEERLYVVSEPIAAVALGVALGPVGLDLLHLSDLGEPLVVVEQFSRLTVGVAVMAAAIRLPEGYFREHARSMAWILVPGMVGTWLVGALLVAALTDIPVLVAILVGAVLTPTDPVLAGTIVTGHSAEVHIPETVRDLLTGESGANDGLAYPLVFLPILLVQHPLGGAVVEWLLSTLLWEVGVAIVVGALLGAAAGSFETFADEHDLLEETSLLSVTVALTFAVLGTVKLLGSDGILAAFVAGLAFTRLANDAEQGEEQMVQETVLRLFTFPVFVIFGLVLPWNRWAALGLAGVSLAAAVLVFRRLLMVLIFRHAVPAVEETRDALFAGWFGPIGIAALFYATVAHRLLGLEVVWTVTSLVVASSVLVHGATASPFTILYGRRQG